MLYRCKNCGDFFDTALNSSNSCRIHKNLFVCRPHPADHYTFEINDNLLDSLSNWPAKFWDCCGSEDANSPGCSYSYHKTYDE